MSLRRFARAAGWLVFLVAVMAAFLIYPSMRAMAAGGGLIFGRGFLAARVLSVAFSGDGKRLAAVAKGTPFFIWDTATGREIGQISAKGWKPQRWSLALSPHGRLLAAGTMPTLRHSLVPSVSGLVHNANITLWQTEAPNLHNRLEEFEPMDPHFAASLAFSPDGKYLAAGEIFDGPQHHLVVWDVAKAKAVRGFSRWGIGIVSLRFSSESQVAGQPAGFRKSPVVLWDIRTGKTIKTYSGCDVAVMLAFSPNGRTLAGARGRNICEWDVRTGDKRGSVRLKQGILVALAFSSDQSLVAASTGGVSMWDTNKLREAGRCAIPQIRMPAQFSLDGKLLAWGDVHKPLVHLWDVAGCKEIRSFTMQPNR